MILLYRCLHAFQALRHNRAGALLPLAALGLTMFFGAVALAVDHGYYNLMQDRMAQAAQSAVLHAADNHPGSGWDTNAKNLFHAMMPADNFYKNIAPTLDITVSQPEADTPQIVNFIARGHVQTFFASALGFESLPLTFQATADTPFQSLEIALVLDISASMLQCFSEQSGIDSIQICSSVADSRLGRFKTALESMVRQLFNDIHKGPSTEGRAGRINFSIIPFANAVRVGAKRVNKWSRPYDTANLEASLLDPTPSLNLESMLAHPDPSLQESNACLRVRARTDFAGSDHRYDKALHCGMFDRFKPAGNHILRHLLNNVNYFGNFPTAVQWRIRNKFSYPYFSNSPGSRLQFPENFSLKDDFTEFSSNERFERMRIINHDYSFLSHCSNPRESSFAAALDINDTPPTGGQAFRFEKLQIPDTQYDFGHLPQPLDGDRTITMPLSPTAPIIRQSLTPPPLTMNDSLCPPHNNELLPLTHDEGLIIRRLRGLGPKGGSLSGIKIDEALLFSHAILNEGIAWGLRTLSPRWRDHWNKRSDHTSRVPPRNNDVWDQDGLDRGRPPGEEAPTLKKMIIITDGANDPFFSAYSRGNTLLGTTKKQTDSSWYPKKSPAPPSTFEGRFRGRRPYWRNNCSNMYWPHPQTWSAHSYTFPNHIDTPLNPSFTFPNPPGYQGPSIEKKSSRNTSSQVHRYWAEFSRYWWYSHSQLQIMHVNLLDSGANVGENGYYQDIFCYPLAKKEMDYRLYKELFPALHRRDIEVFTIMFEGNPYPDAARAHGQALNLYANTHHYTVRPATNLTKEVFDRIRRTILESQMEDRNLKAQLTYSGPPL